MTMRKSGFDENDLINQYLSGKSIKKLASDYGFCRQVVYRVLREHGVHIRDRSESMFVRMSQMTPEERKANAMAAHAAKRGVSNSEDSLYRIAQHKKKRVGVFEKDFCEKLEEAGITVFPQEPFLRYNLDIGCGDIAVEIHTQKACPLNKRYVNKIVNCLEGGKSMLYVWISPRNLVVDDLCYQNVVSIVQEFRRNPPARSKYWVVRSTGEIYAAGSLDSD